MPLEDRIKELSSEIYELQEQLEEAQAQAGAREAAAADGQRSNDSDSDARLEEQLRNKTEECDELFTLVQQLRAGIIEDINSEFVWKKVQGHMDACQGYVGEPPDGRD